MKEPISPKPKPKPKPAATASKYPTKAYAPVPKGYKGNWNVPAGTPWKKDSPFNPANSPSAKKASESKSQREAVSARRSSQAAATKAEVSSRPTPQDRAGSRMNVKRAAESNRASQREAAKKQTSSPTSRVTKAPPGYKKPAPPAGNKNYR